MDMKSFQFQLMDFLNEKNCKRLFILCFCMSAFIFGFQNYTKGQKTLSGKVNSAQPTETKTNPEIKNNTTSTSIKE